MCSPSSIPFAPATPFRASRKPSAIEAGRNGTSGRCSASIRTSRLWRAQTTTAAQSDANGKPNYAALIDPKDSARQMRCLSEAIYFEARGEPEHGQAAVAQVVLNRVRSGIFPTNVCAVVYQDRNHPFACQFSFACEGKSLRVEEPGAWATATHIAERKK